MRWIDPGDPLTAWTAVVGQPLPPPGRFGLRGAFRRVTSSAEWLLIDGERWGGWVYLDDAERSLLDSIVGRRVDLAANEPLAHLWRRGLVEIDGRHALTSFDWEATIEETREHYSLVLLLNSGCNLVCTYCYLGHAAPVNANAMTADTARAAIAAALAKPWPTLLIDFGEIAVATPMFRELVVYAEQAGAAEGKRVRFSIQTNGTTLTPQLVDFLVAHRVSVGLSLDGPAAVHDRARVLRGGIGTHDRASRGARLCREAGLPLHLIATIARHNIDHALEVVDELMDHHPDSFLLKPVLAEGEAERAWEGEGVSADRHARFMAEVIRSADEQGLERLDQSAGRFLLRALGDRGGWRDSCTSRHCGSGRSLHVVAPAGEVHACPRFVHPGAGRSTAVPVAFGRTRDRPAPLDLSDLLEPSLRRAPVSCAGCPWLASCGGGCTLIAQDGLDEPVPQPDPHCDTHTVVHESLFERVIPSYLDGRHSGTKAFNGAVARSADLVGTSSGSVPVR